MQQACRGLIDGATTLELDNGITLDGEVVVWHDEDIIASKCQDTAPAVGLYLLAHLRALINRLNRFQET
jgi:glycerophosphoryl diester phosphodiesterase